MTEQIMRQIIAKQSEIIRHFKMAYYHNGISFKNGSFFISRKVKKVTKELENLNEQLKQAEAESGTNLMTGQSWICPRCQKVHNWMVQSCDCPANVITANTTGPIKELAEISGEASCNNCKYQDTCNENSDDECKWEPIKTE